MSGEALVSALDRVTRADALRVGHKAANLGELAGAGFPVPPGYVLTTVAYGRFLDAANLAPDRAAALALSAPMPPEVLEALEEVAGKLGDGPWAVRSSATAEDLAEASFAGQYETVLGVQGCEALARAVRRCWASALAPRLTAYRAARGIRETPAMAVLIQRQVAAEAAGVVFTANPVTGDREEAVVSAVRGLGDRLVSGEVSPDEWVVRGDHVECRRSSEGALDVAGARAVAALARRVADHFGCPQDVEWAMQDAELFLLQARAITALPAAQTEEAFGATRVPPGFWVREDHVAKPLSPAAGSILRPIYLDGMREALAQFGVLAEGVELREIGGWPYIRLVPLGGKEPPPLPPWLAGLVLPWLIRLVPAMRRRLLTCRQFLRTDRAGAFLERWTAEWKPQFVERGAALRGVDRGALSDHELDGHLIDTVEHLRKGWQVHALLMGPYFLGLADLVFTCRELLGWDDDHTLQLLAGLSERSSEPARRMAELVDAVRERPALRKLLEDRAGVGLEELSGTDPQFQAILTAYMQAFGCRVLNDELDGPTLEEEPGILLRLVRHQLAQGYDPRSQEEGLTDRRTAARAAAEKAVAGLEATRRERFARDLARAERAYGVREDNVFHTWNMPLALVRYALREVGRRLAARGIVERWEDVFFLELEESRRLLREGGSCRDLVRRRRGEYAWAMGHPGPAAYGKEPAPPPLSALPPEARLMAEAVQWAFERVGSWRQEARPEGGMDGVLRGTAAAPGRYTGPVRIVRSEAEFDKLQPGDVLVCPITTPVWSVLFPSLGGLVTDHGGILSHPAIIAREFGVPAVVGTGMATERLGDGQVVTVEGDAGVVRVVTG